MKRNMKRINLLTLLIGLLTLLPIASAHSLTVKEFSNICNQYSGDCHELPIVNAYIGGAMDLIATLDEKTDYFPTKIYCTDPREIFDGKEIVDFILTNDHVLPAENAMLSFIKYFEINGGCSHE